MTDHDGVQLQGQKIRRGSEQDGGSRRLKGNNKMLGWHPSLSSKASVQHFQC